MATSDTKPRVTSFAPQLLVDDLARSMAYYRKLGFAFGEPWGGFYAIGQLDGLAATTWGTKDFYVEDPDGNLIAFGGRPAEE
jgi:catechol 2,3-dioxygenase-like lactoylglutathione lyase family enzyme